MAPCGIVRLWAVVLGSRSGLYFGCSVTAGIADENEVEGRYWIGWSFGWELFGMLM